MCNMMVSKFLTVCGKIGVPIAEDKTVWATCVLVFLGILLNGRDLTFGIPEEKRQKTIYLLSKLIDKKKAMVRELQMLCRFLNFLNKVIYPGCVFMRCMCSKFAHFCENNHFTTK